MPERASFDHQQTAHAIKSVAVWLDLREKHGYAEKYLANSTEAFHSGLLYRLLRGVDPLPEPPEDSRRAGPNVWPDPTWTRAVPDA